MNVVAARPPNFAAIVRALPGASRPGVLFTYGEALYNPAGTPIADWLIAHERAHSAHQGAVGVESWWQQYLTRSDFRYHAELLGHAAEYDAQILPEMGRRARAELLRKTALRLTATLYRYQPRKSLRQAARDLEAEAFHIAMRDGICR